MYTLFGSHHFQHTHLQLLPQSPQCPPPMSTPPMLFYIGFKISSTQICMNVEPSIGHGCDGYSWLSARLHLELTKTQTTQYICKGFFFLGSFKVGKPTLNLGHLRWEDPALIWAMPSADNLHKGLGRREHLLFVCLSSLLLASLLLHRH